MPVVLSSLSASDPKMKKVYTIKYIKEVLKNYEGTFFKDDGYYCVDVNFDQWYFATRQELLNWATFYFWNREMAPAGCEY